MSSFNISLAQYLSAYLAIITCIKIVGKIAAILYTVITCVDTFSWFYDLNLESGALYNLCAAHVVDWYIFCDDVSVSFHCEMCRFYEFIEHKYLDAFPRSKETM
jgi:hypothetical protein